jgi:hypothetical protein
MRKQKAVAAKLAITRHKADLRRKKVASAKPPPRPCELCQNGLEINFDRVAQLRALPKAEQEKLLGTEALQVLDVLVPV